MVRTSPSNADGVDSIPGQEAKISHGAKKTKAFKKKKKFQDIGMSRREASIWGGEKGWDFSFGHFESEVSLGHPVVCALQVGVGSGVGRKTYQEEKILTATARN